MNGALRQSRSSRIRCSEPNVSIRTHVVSPSFNPSRRKVAAISKDRTLALSRNIAFQFGRVPSTPKHTCAENIPHLSLLSLRNAKSGMPLNRDTKLLTSPILYDTLVATYYKLA